MGTDVSTAHSNTVAQCSRDQNITHNGCGIGSFPLSFTNELTRTGLETVFASTTLSALTCTTSSNRRRRLNNDLTQSDTTFFMSSHIASHDILFKSTPKVTSNSPQRESVDVSISSDETSGNSREDFCYFVTKTLNSELDAPKCGFAADGKAQCIAPAKQFTSAVKITSSSYVVAISCGSREDRSAPSNRTAVWIEVLPAERDNATGTGGGIGIDDDDDGKKETNADIRGEPGDLLAWWAWLLIVLLLCCCCLLLLLCLICLKKRRERDPKKRRGGRGGGNLDYTLKQSNPMGIQTAALAAGVPVSEYSPRTKISMMSRLGSKPMVALQEAHHVELSTMRETPRPSSGLSTDRVTLNTTRKRDTSLSGLSAIPETLTSRKELPAPEAKTQQLVAPPPAVPPAPGLVPKTPGNS